MKLGIFTDPHYSSKELSCRCRYNNQSLRKIKAAYSFFERENCDLIVCLGDLIDTEPTRQKELENLSEIAEVVKASSIPTVCLMGNHDAFVLEQSEFYQTLGIAPPADMQIDGRNLLFIDACYFENGKHYQPGDSNWRDTFFPHEKEFAEKLKSLQGDTYVFVHQNIDSALHQDHRLFNADSLMQIMKDSNIVKTVFQGHYHPGITSNYDGIQYITLPAMCENEDAVFIFDI